MGWLGGADAYVCATFFFARKSGQLLFGLFFLNKTSNGCQRGYLMKISTFVILTVVTGVISGKWIDSRWKTSK
ncbi:hypothetical protein SAMN05428962_4700 [Paenibacillus sp. BC26]|nr:hypothetical protein SAMN05428962_4700 [Paenibacillus sp. BC26]